AEGQVRVVEAVGLGRRAHGALRGVLRILERDANLDALAALLRDDARDRGLEEPRVDRSPRVAGELLHAAQRDDERATVDALVDLERRRGLEEHVRAAVLRLEADPRQRALGRRLLRLLAGLGLLRLAGLHT